MHGRTHCSLDGSSNAGALVVLVHGFSTCLDDMQFLADALVRRHSRRVLRFDLYGRGHSACDATPQTLAFFAGQLVELLYALGDIGALDLCGYSMGGAVCTQFAATHPHRVRTLTLIASAGSPCCRDTVLPRGRLPGTPVNAWLALACGPLRSLVGAVVARRLTDAEALVAEWARPTSPRAVAYAGRTAQRPASEAALGRSLGLSLAYIPWGEIAPLLDLVDEAGTPVCLVWGTEDAICPVSGCDFIRSRVKRARVVEVKGATHAVALEDAERIAGEMAEFHADPSGAPQITEDWTIM